MKSIDRLIEEEIQRLTESEEVLSEFEKVFPRKIVRADPKERPFEVTEENMQKIFGVLNGIVFENMLKEIPIICRPYNQLVAIQKAEFNFDIPMEIMKDVFAFHCIVPVEVREKHRYELGDIEKIFVNTSNGNTSFGFSVGNVCHEMAHQYDFHFGQALKFSYSSKKFGIPINLHNTSEFKRIMKKSNRLGIPMKKDGENKSFNQLNQEEQEFFLGLKEYSPELTEDILSNDNRTFISENKDGTVVIVNL